MDANQQRFWMLADAADWAGSGTEHAAVEHDAVRRTLRLRDRRSSRAQLGAVNESAGEALVTTPSRAIDEFGTIAQWNPMRRSVEAVGGLSDPDAGAEPVTLWIAGAGQEVSDLTMGSDDVLYLAIQQRSAGGEIVSSSVGMFDPRGRWRRPRVFEVPTPGFDGDQLAAAPGGGVWVMDRVRGLVGRVRGLPLRDGLPPRFAPTTFRPSDENPDPPRFHIESEAPAFGTGRPVALACSSGGRLAVLAWRDPGQTWLHVRDDTGRWRARRLVEAGRSASLAWLSPERIAVLPAPSVVGGRNRAPVEAMVYDLGGGGDGATPLPAAGGFHPVRGLAESLFVKGATLPPHYPVSDLRTRSRPLRPLSFVSYSRSGSAFGRRLDSGREQAVWHRLYCEAVLPPGCRITVELAATDDPDASELEWHPHVVGELSAEDQELQGPDRPALASWLKDRSELPHHGGVLGRDPEPERVGLFTALIQRPGRRVRRLAGRYLHTRVRLIGTGHQTPELGALRCYASRFSYRDEYLPELFGEHRFGADANAAGAATGADFLERFLGLFESVLTPLEDRAATAQAVMDPRSVRADALDWLGSWLGVVFDPSFPEMRRRAWLEAAPRLFRARGTMAGLQLALEISTGGRLQRTFVDEREHRRRGTLTALDPDSDVDVPLREVRYPAGGAVTGGEVIVLEEYRLRRTFATLLGVRLDDAADPLLPGLSVSANSRVGDTLILGEAERTELLALFRDAFDSDPAEREREVAEVRRFYSRFAHRVAIFVHDQVAPVDLGLLERIAAREAPAHVKVRVLRTTEPLLVGLSSLVDFDTYLGAGRQPTVARLNHSRLGEGDFVRRRASLDPRLDGDASPPWAPTAHVTGPSHVDLGDDVELDGAGSSAAPGRHLTRYRWVLDERP